MSIALVLGGGGITGAAWEAGILKGLKDAGIDLTEADLIVGTSAGAVVGAAITTGGLDAFWERQIGPVDTSVERAAAIDQQKFMAALSDAGLAPHAGADVSSSALARLGQAHSAAELSESALASLGQAAVAAHVDFSEEDRLRTMASRVGANEWPHRRLMITAVDCEDGSRKVWTRDSNAPLVAAVASSCAAPFVYPPATINGRRYMDGGMWSATNVDLARGSELVVVITPVPRRSPLAGALEANVEALRAEGAAVTIIEPDAITGEIIKQGPVDPSNRRPAAEAGLAQSADVAVTLPGWVGSAQPRS